jgi:general secretion pathway protein I
MPASPSIPPAARRQRGFSLIEVLVAFMILAMSLTVIFRIFSGGLRNISLSQDYARAALVASSQLSVAGISEPLEAGVTAGEWGERYQWERVIEHYDPWPESRKLLVPLRAYRVTVKVSWQHAGGNSQISLSSLRLQPEQPVQRKG